MSTTPHRFRQHIDRVRSDLSDIRTNNVQVRAIIGFCDDGGVPRHKNRYFLVTPRVGRQVEIGGRKQDRSLLHPACDQWNIAKDGKSAKWIDNLAGGMSLRIRLQHIEIDDAYDVGCRCQSDPTGKCRPPGRAPFCASRDMQTAQRWDGNDFASIPCLAGECPLRWRHTDDKGREFTPAKTEFVLTGVLDEEGLPPLLLSTMTGSDYNLHQFGGLIERVEADWHMLCHPPQVPAEQHLEMCLSWYDIPILLTVYESSDGGGRYPRIHYTLGCPLEEIFERMARFVSRMAGNAQHVLVAGRTPLQLTAAQLTEGFRELDNDEVLNPTTASPDPDKSPEASTVQPGKPPLTPDEVVANMKPAELVAAVQAAVQSGDPAIVDAAARKVLQASKRTKGGDAMIADMFYPFAGREGLSADVAKVLDVYGLQLLFDARQALAQAPDSPSLLEVEAEINKLDAGLVAALKPAIDTARARLGVEG